MYKLHNICDGVKKRPEIWFIISFTSFSYTRCHFYSQLPNQVHQIFLHYSLIFSWSSFNFSIVLIIWRHYQLQYIYIFCILYSRRSCICWRYLLACWAFIIISKSDDIDFKVVSSLFACNHNFLKIKLSSKLNFE